MGQFAVGACLRFFYGCKLVAYNQQFYHVKLEEIDVVGVDPLTNTVYMCEVIIKLGGLKLGPDNKATLEIVRGRFEKMKYYGEKFFANHNRQYMFWSPYVPKGELMESLFKLGRDLDMNVSFKINKLFTDQIEKLRDKAEMDVLDYGEPFFRALQIVAHSREK